MPTQTSRPEPRPPAQQSTGLWISGNPLWRPLIRVIERPRLWGDHPGPDELADPAP